MRLGGGGGGREGGGGGGEGEGRVLLRRCCLRRLPSPPPLLLMLAMRRMIRKVRFLRIKSKKGCVLMGGSVVKRKSREVFDELREREREYKLGAKSG